VANADAELIFVAIGHDLDVPLAPRESVLDGVRHDLRQGERERVRVLARQRAEGSGFARVRDRVLRRGDLGNETQYAAEHLIEVDLLAQTLGERVVYDGDRRDALHRLQQRLLGLVARGAARLDPQ